MSDGHKLARLMREAGRQPQNEVVDIITGEVTSVNPLKVKIENRELTQSFLIVGALCKETKIPMTDGTTGSTDSPKLMLWRGLRVKDRVFMLKVGRGQKYFILQREEGVV